jgi:hypothetical protein
LRECKIKCIESSIYMFLIELFIGPTVTCKFLAAVSCASVSLIYPASLLVHPHPLLLLSKQDIFCSLPSPKSGVRVRQRGNGEEKEKGSENLCWQSTCHL